MGEVSAADLLTRIEQGDEPATFELMDRYAERLIALAHKRMSKKLARRIDPEDIVQSACRSFFRNAQLGRYEVRDSDDLWRLLGRHHGPQSVATSETTLRGKARPRQRGQLWRRNSDPIRVVASICSRSRSRRSGHTRGRNRTDDGRPVARTSCYCRTHTARPRHRRDGRESLLFGAHCAAGLGAGEDAS